MSGGSTHWSEVIKFPEGMNLENRTEAIRLLEFAASNDPSMFSRIKDNLAKYHPEGTKIEFQITDSGMPSSAMLGLEGSPLKVTVNTASSTDRVYYGTDGEEKNITLERISFHELTHMADEKFWDMNSEYLQNFRSQKLSEKETSFLKETLSDYPIFAAALTGENVGMFAQMEDITRLISNEPRKIDELLQEAKEKGCDGITKLFDIQTEHAARVAQREEWTVQQVDKVISDYDSSRVRGEYGNFFSDSTPATEVLRLNNTEIENSR